MMSVKHNYSFIFPLFCFAFLLPFITTLPVTSSDDPLDKFVEFLRANNCSVPNAVDIPFPLTDTTPFSFLYTPMKECQSLEALKDSNEAHLLCKEAFDVLQNITCYDYSSLPKINSGYLSQNVCKDFAEIQSILPKQSDYLSGKLGDGIICKVLCTGQYELLCKTLLWSYDTQAKIKKAAMDFQKLKEIPKESINEISNNHDPNEKITAEPGESGVEDHNKEANEIPNQIKVVPGDQEVKVLPKELSLSNTELKPPTPKSTSSEEAPKAIFPLNSIKDRTLVNTVNVSQGNQHTVPSTQADDKQKSTLIDNVQPSDQNSELPDKNVHVQESGIEKSGNTKAETPSQGVSQVNSAAPEIVDNKNGGSNTSSVSSQVNENNSKSSTNAKPIENPVVPVETEIESGVNNVSFQEPSENEIKDEKVTELKKNPKENLIPDGVIPVEAHSNLLSSTTVPVYSDKNEEFEPRPDVKDTELYNGAFSPSLKKESSLDDGSNHISSNSGIRISPDSFAGRVESQNYLPGRNYLPEQEDSHFFFYFLSIVLILMAGYLIFHNKQKIIALIVEGRHERRRRSHGAGYKKLETK